MSQEIRCLFQNYREKVRGSKTFWIWSEEQVNRSPIRSQLIPLDFPYLYFWGCVRPREAPIFGELVYRVALRDGAFRLDPVESRSLGIAAWGTSL